MKLFILIFFTLLPFTLFAQSVRVAAAGNIRYVLEEIKVKYKIVYPNAKIDVVVGSSGSLYQQILNGANYDLFLAADNIYPNKLKEQKLATGDVKTYAFGKLALWSNTVNISKGMNALKESTVKHIAIANPQVAPYGERAVHCLKFYKIIDSVKDKLVYAENIAQAAQFAQTGNAEVGIIALSLALAPEMKNSGKFYILDTKSYKPVEQGCILIKNKEVNPEAKRFMNFILSKECKPLFEKYGYIVP